MSIRNIRRQATNPTAAPGTPNSAPIYVDSDDNIMKMIPTGSGTTEVQVVDASSTQTMTNKTLTTPTLTAPIITAPSGSASTGMVISKSVAFIENGAATSYTGTVPIPAGARLHDIQVSTTVLWNGTSASLDVGDDDDANGFFAAVSVKATDLALGEQLSILTSETWGAKQGVYLVAATGRKGQATSDSSGGHYTTANNIIGVITPGAGDGSAGRTFMTVTYSLPDAIAQVTV